jgi:glycosyltransferase involved in cell wall biosynthesis
MESACALTILMPCLNEAETLARCISKAKSFLICNSIRGEIVVADNGSSDGSQQIAEACGARVVTVSAAGYGNALRGGISAARGNYIVMGDSDDSYDFSRLELFLEKLEQGFDLVMGNRFRGGIGPHAMPALHRYLGNPVLTAVGRIFFGSPCGDFHCGLRAFRRDSILRLGLQAPGMEFASEMIVKATLQGLRIAEVPTTLSQDGRGRAPHLRSWRDGWRHLRFLLLFCPRWLFLYPGAVLFGIGLCGMVWLLPAPRSIVGITFGIDSLFYCCLAILVGFQSMLFWLFANIFAAREGLLPESPRLQRFLDTFALELGLLIGCVLLFTGLALGVFAVASWGAARFGPLSPEDIMRIVIPSGAAISLAFEVGYGSFFISVLSMRSTVPRELGTEGLSSWLADVGPKSNIFDVEHNKA